MIHHLLTFFKSQLIVSLSFINQLIKKKDMWLFYCDTVRDNTKYLMQYVVRHSDMPVICYDNGTNNRARVYQDQINYITSTVKLFYYMVRCGYIVTSFDHRFRIRPSKEQRTVHLMHGCTLKNCGTDYLLPDKQRRGYYYTDILCHGDVWKEIYCKGFGCSESQLRHWDNPRNDLLFQPVEKNKLEDFFGLKYEKLILWMPTFRQSDSLKRNDSSIGIPFINLDNIDTINQALQEAGNLLIIKPHPAQNSLSKYIDNKSNIRILTNQMIEIMEDVELYHLIGAADAMITDYSSVYYDYLILNKPIAFAVEDFEIYSSKRGFAFDNPKQYMPGFFVQSLEELLVFLKNPYVDDEYYFELRQKVNDLFYWRDGNNSERIFKDLIRLRKKQSSEQETTER